MRKDTVSVCQICRDPVWTFICPDCLAKDIKTWLPESLQASFETFYAGLDKHFHATTDSIFEYCAKCTCLIPVTLCPFCFIVEAYHWLKERDSEKAYQLYKMLPLGRDWKVTELDGCMWKEGFKPLSEAKWEHKEFGVCDDCGEYSNELVTDNGKWICHSCNQL